MGRGAAPPGPRDVFLRGRVGGIRPAGDEVAAFHFHHPEAVAQHDEAFSGAEESRALYQRIAASAGELKAHLYAFADRFALDMIITQNAQAIPMQIALGVALRDFIDETHIPTIGHHHDFYWERERFIVNRIPDILRTAFPSEGTSTRHVVISTAMQRELAMRRRLSATYVRTCSTFATRPRRRTPTRRRCARSWALRPTSG